MKYKVSLLPEKNRKRLNSKKKAEKVKVFALIALFMMFALLLVTMSLKFYADDVLEEERARNAKYTQLISELSEYKAINDTLQAKVALIESIQVDEPSLCNFIASLSNVKHTDISIESIDCTDWKTSRSCTLTGTCYDRDAFLLYVEKLQEIEGVSGATCNQFASNYVDGEMSYQFVIFISCTGGKAPVVVDTTAAAS